MKALLPLAVQGVMTSQRAAEQREKLRLCLFLRFFMFYLCPCAFEPGVCLLCVCNAAAPPAGASSAVHGAASWQRVTGLISASQINVV